MEEKNPISKEKWDEFYNELYYIKLRYIKEGKIKLEGNINTKEENTN